MLFLEIKQIKLRNILWRNIRPSLVNSTNIILTSRGDYEKKKKNNQTKIESSIRGKLSISNMTGCFERDLWLKLGRYINFSFEFTTMKSLSRKRFLPHRNPVWSGKYLKSFFHYRDITCFFIFISYVSLFVFIVHLSRFIFLYSLLTIYSFTTVDNIWEGKGFRKSYASEILINMTNNHNLFTNYGLFPPCSIFILKRAIITGNHGNIYSFAKK